MYNNQALTQTGQLVTELPALEDFVSRFQKALEETNSLGNRLYSISNKLNVDPPTEQKAAVPMQPRRFNEGLLSQVESLLGAFQDQINYQDHLIRKIESLV